MNRTEQMQHVRSVLLTGATTREASAATGVPASTIARWALGKTDAFGAGVPRQRRGPRPRIAAGPDWRPPDRLSYSYLLGLYLGDGCLSRAGRTFRLQLSLDGAYPEIIEDAIAAMRLTGPNPRVRVWAIRDSRCRTVTSHWVGWPAAFPQHGPGRKHLRKIELADWQQDIVNDHPTWFLRGLIQSDGCRTINRFKTKLPSGRVAEYAYPRYFFSNLSSDIRELFCATCDDLGIRWTMSNPRNVSVSHRTSVAKLDEFIGPKG